MSLARSPRQINPWKLSTLLLAGALAFVIGTDRVSSADAAGPARLTKALSALKAGKKHLDEAKEPPAAQHAQSVLLVGQAISAVEREIKAYEALKEKNKDKDKDRDRDRDKEKPAKGEGKAAKKKDGEKKPKHSRPAEGGAEE
jgi:hypothetical protein